VSSECGREVSIMRRTLPSGGGGMHLNEFLFVSTEHNRVKMKMATVIFSETSKATKYGTRRKNKIEDNRLNLFFIRF
jgi:hypothetical protein